MELEADASGIEYYLSLSDNLTVWQESEIRFADGAWTLNGAQASLEETHDLGAGRWRVVFGLPTYGFARMKIRVVD